MNRIASSLLVSFAIAAANGNAQEGPEIVASCPGSIVAPGSTVSAGFSVSGLPLSDAQVSFTWTLKSAPSGFAFSSPTDTTSVTVSGTASTIPGLYTITVEFDYPILLLQEARPRVTPGTARLTGSCSFAVPTPPPPVPALSITGTCSANAYSPGDCDPHPAHRVGRQRAIQLEDRLRQRLYSFCDDWLDGLCSRNSRVGFDRLHGHRCRYR